MTSSVIKIYIHVASFIDRRGHFLFLLLLFRSYLILINFTWLKALSFNNLHQCYCTGTAGESHKSQEIKSLTIETS